MVEKKLFDINVANLIKTKNFCLAPGKKKMAILENTILKKTFTIPKLSLKLRKINYILFI